MRKLLIFLLFGVGIIQAQVQQSDHKGSVLSGAGQVEIDLDLQLQFQIGATFLYPQTPSGQSTKTALGFPFGVLYVPNTFSDKRFEVSKGYYPDKVNISWSIGANEEHITKINIYRKPLVGETPYNLIATLGSEVFQFEDTQTEGGVLYKYKVVAEGVSNIEQKFVTFIEGIGFRNPTAYVSGTISFEGGSPVKDVKVLAEPVGAEGSSGKGYSMEFKDYGEHLYLNKSLDNVSAENITVQGWYAPKKGVSGLRTYEFSTESGRKFRLVFFSEFFNDDFAQLRVEFIEEGVGFIRDFHLQHSYPTGEIDASGKDIFASISDITDETFFHISTVLENGKAPAFFLNGREITAAYIANASVPETIKKPHYNPGAVKLYNSSGETLSSVLLGTDYVGYVDEFRLWSKALTDAEIRRDYKRYLDGSESGLEMYNRFDEGAGSFAYDLSKTGFDFHKNDLITSQANTTNTVFSRVRPSKEQLGVSGITDKDGSYAISAIPYSGSGEQFKITPSFGVHKFNPASQTLFLGKNESVVNKVNFEDISSFKFNGRIVYDTRNVFNRSEDLADPALDDIKEIRETGYNTYLVDGTTTLNKGEYFYEGANVSVNAATGNLEGGTLYRYPVIGVADATLYIDGQPVFDEDNQPIVTDSEGKFAINVPIGKHKVEVSKNGHVFAYEGRFPEKTADVTANTFDFYEDQIQERWFLDETRVTVVGRVIGGSKESAKEIGFGFDGLKEHNNEVAEGEPEQKEVYSSKNNIGQATITFKGELDTNLLNHVVTTNVETGEYKIDLIPYKYYVKTEGGINVANNDALNSEFLDANKELDFTEIKETTVSTFIGADGTEFVSEPYHFVENFRYNSPINVQLIEQEYEKTFDVGGDVIVDVSELEVPLYKQKEQYRIAFEVTQDYINKDGEAPVTVKEYYNEGTFNITNNFASSNPADTSIELVRNLGKELYVYSFRAGLPNITHADGFKNAMTIEYNVSGLNPIAISNIGDFKEQGIVIGGRSAEGTTFSTVAPQVPDIILRDPPGSNSFASIERGSTISFQKYNGRSSANTAGGGLYASVGPTFTNVAGTPFFSLETEISVVADIEANFSLTQEINEDGSATETYQFNETISTSDDPEYVGADGDLYIGNAKNIYYGMINNMFVTPSKMTFNDGSDVPHIVVNAKTIVEEGEEPEVTQIYISSREDYFIAEQPTNTFFTYSQRHILETLIPDLQALANNTATDRPEGELQSQEFYLAQIKLWQQIIQDNERDKYLALNNRSVLKQMALNKVKNEQEKVDGNKSDLDIVNLDIINLDINSLGNKVFDFIFGLSTENQEAYLNNLKNQINENFEGNKSFDAGVGEYTSSVSTTTVVSKSYEKTIDMSEDFKIQLGALINNVGVVGNIAGARSDVFTNSEQFDNEKTTTFSYTLKDNDQANVLSVDVVNLFDGFGPVFITKGGATSCPYEAETLSTFYKNEGYNENSVGVGGEELSVATINVFKPELTVNKTLISNLAENAGAVFTLQLKNLSATNTDLEYLLYVDQTTLNGAESNIDQNGIRVFLPYNETVEVPFIITKNSASDVYDYENIRVYLANPCIDLNDSDAFVDVSVNFKKSCSTVSIAAPQNNWVYNRTEAFTYDNEGNFINTKPLGIKFTDFNTDFNGFRKISLQYRNANAANWTQFKTYYGSEALKTEASDENGIVIGSETDFTFNWDIVGTNIVDGNYEIRAVAFCTDNISTESDIITGTINLTPPVVFGTPSPSDGILDIGEDIKIRFNEEINTHISTNITVRGLKNQQAIDHSVSVALDGSSNTIALPKQNLLSKAFSIQFWLDVDETGNGILVNQNEGPKISLDGNKVVFELDGQTVEAVIDTTQYNFYSFIYGDGADPFLRILQNGNELKTELFKEELSFNNNNTITIGGSGVKGNIHDIRIWNKATTNAQAAAEKDFTLTGKELKLLGYWPLDEGHGVTGVEKVRARNAEVNLSWTIKPKGQGYAFSNNSYLTLDNVGFVQPTNYEDITISFWVKAASGDTGTIFGNGTGDENLGEPELTNGFRNKWDISLKADGNLKLRTEGVDYQLTSNAITDDNWHHVAVVVKRGGSLNTFIDGEQEASVSSQNIGGIAGDKLYFGARNKKDIPTDPDGVVIGGTTTGEGEEEDGIIENHFTGKLDEFRLWNTARSFEQIKRDRYFELDKETTGLMLYVNFNEEEANVPEKGPRYNVRKGDGSTLGYLAVLSADNVRKFIEDSPAIKPVLKYTNIPFTTVINGDEMIISPTLTTEEWSLFEGQIVDVSVANMYDNHFNKQLSPVSFSALVNKQEVNWFTENGTKEIVTEKNINSPYNFVMDVVNKGGNNQDFTVSGLPSWMTVSANSGIVGANATKQLEFTVDSELAMGSYTATIYLNLDNGYTDRLDLDLRVLQEAPDWSVNPADFAFSMSIISQIKIYDSFSRDAYTKVGAFVDGVKRGEAYLVYDSSYDSYYAFLTMYSNVSANEQVTFKVWDALNGKVRTATINGQATTVFIENNVMGTKSNPIIFSAGTYAEQVISLNKGWTWASFFVEDDRFGTIADVFEGLETTEGDIFKNSSQFTRFENGSWNGDLTSLENDKSYKVLLDKANIFKLKGTEVDTKLLDIVITQGWNWLSFPIHRNISIKNALAFYEPSEGDLIKDQYSFAIYDANAAEWTGSLHYLQSNRGYMLKSEIAQTFNYPTINFASKGVSGGQEHTQEMISNFAKYQYSMGIIAQIKSDEVFDQVKVYDENSVLRGVSSIENKNGSMLSFITAFSDVTEKLRYVLVNSKNEVEVSKELLFIPDGILGTLKTPVVLEAKSLAVESNLKGNVTIYPNPFINEITINFLGDIKVTNIILYNTLGAKVKEVKVSSKSKIKMDTNNLPVGVFFVKIIDDEGRQLVKKLIKK